MPSVQEILKSTGLSDEQIAALDAKVTGAFTQVLSTADQTLQQAELAKRAQSEMYEKDIAPALDNWANEKASYDARLAAYDAALKSAKEGGFKVPDILAPANPANRDNGGRFVPNANAVPGSPAFEQKMRDELAGAFSFVADTSWKYRTLFGTEMPDSPTAIIREATAQRMSAADYAAKKYDFAGAEKKKRDEEQNKVLEAARKEEREKVTKELTEKLGSNPMIRQAEVSRFADVTKAVKEGSRPDPLKMPNREQRHRETQQRIQQELADNATIQ